MRLEPEQREVGQENFHAATGSSLINGALLEETIRDGLSSKKGLGSRYFGYGEVDRPIRIGIVGTGDEGGVLIGALNPKYVQVVAIADIRPYNVYRAFHGDKSSPNARRARPGLMSIYGWADEETARGQVKVYTDGYEDLLDDENVEAVIIALPLHLHAEASIKAMRKGKHVLCEKLMGHSVAECKEMARVAEKEDKLLAIGHQRHYSVLYENAVELIRKGLIGQIHHIRAQWHRGNLPGKDSWKPTLPTDRQMQDQLEEIQAALEEAKKSFEEKKAQAKEKLDEKTLALLDKWDKELVKHPQDIADLNKELADMAAAEKPDESRREEIQTQIAAKEKRIRDINREYFKRLGLDPKKYNTVALEEKIEILSQKLKDAEIATKVKDYGYIDFPVGGRTVDALEELIRWRLWDRTGGGLMAELGSHQLDASGIFISSLRSDGNKVHPLSVTAVGGRHIFPHDRDIDDHVYCSFEFPGPDYHPETAPEKKIVVTYSSINGNGYGGYGETVLGTKGTLILDGEKEVMLYSKWNTGKYVRVGGSEKAPKLVDASRGSDEARRGTQALKTPISRGYTEEIEHWAWAIAQKQTAPDKPLEAPLRCGPKVALADAVIALTTNLAVERGKDGKNCRVDFDPEWFDPASDATPEDETPNVDRPEYKV
jgi:predicted dehydrogenase